MYIYNVLHIHYINEVCEQHQFIINESLLHLMKSYNEHIEFCTLTSRKDLDKIKLRKNNSNITGLIYWLSNVGPGMHTGKECHLISFPFHQ